MPKLRPPDWFNQQLDDGGPIYMEYNPGQLVVEPWNAISSLLIIIVAFYWIRLMIRNKNHSTLMWIVVSLVIAGGLGSALFHAFREYALFLFMDVVPTALLTITLSIYFWIRILRKWWIVFFIYIPLFAMRFDFWNKLAPLTAINLSYFISGFSIGLPLIIYLFKTNFNRWLYVAATIVFFSLALTFRQLDKTSFIFLPMGTHFLWHTFSAIGAWFMLGYLYNVLFNRRVERLK